MAREDLYRDSLDRATSGLSVANYDAIFRGFAEKGIPAEQINPRVDVLTFNAWRALGRHVRRGEHGVKVTTWVTAGPKKTVIEADGESKGFRFPKTTTVFHISQTQADPIARQPATGTYDIQAVAA